MTKEELEKEAEEIYTKTDKEFMDCQDEGEIFNLGFLAGAEPREKRIEQLEEENAKLKEINTHTLSQLNLDNGELIIENEKLKKENAELKGLKDVATLIRANNDTVTTLMQLNNMLVSKNQQLTKAKELLERLLITSCNSDVLNLLPNCSEVLRVRVEAEQFLNSEVEK